MRVSRQAVIAIAAAIGLFAASPHGAQTPIPRNRLTVPLTLVGPQTTINDSSFLFEMPMDGNQKWYIPRYRIGARQTTTQASHYEARLERDGAAWLFTVSLDAYPSERLGEAARTARPMNHAFPVWLSFVPPPAPGGTQPPTRSLQFQDVAVQASGLRATLRVQGNDAQMELHSALSDPTWRAHIVVQRRLSVGVPVEKKNPKEPELRAAVARYEGLFPVTLRAYPGNAYLRVDRSSGPYGKPEGFLLENLRGAGAVPSDSDGVVLHTADGRILTATAKGPVQDGPYTETPGSNQRLLIRKFSNWTTSSEFGSTIYYSKGPIGIGTGVKFRLLFEAEALRTETGYNTHLSEGNQAFSFETPPAGDPVFALRQRLIDSVRLAVSKLTREFSTDEFIQDALDLSYEIPATFAYTTHAYIYAGIAPSGQGGLAVRQVESNIYFQDERQLEQFYYLPDRYAIEVLPDGRPNIAVRLTRSFDTYLVEYVAVPVVDFARMQRQQDALKTAGHVANVRLAPYLGVAPRLTLMIPSGAGGDQSARVFRPGAVPDLNGKITDTFILNSAQVQRLFDALFLTNSPIFSGTVGQDEPRFEIPFVAHLNGDRTATWNRVFDPTIPARTMVSLEVIAQPSLLGGAPSAVVEFEHGDTLVLTTQHPRGTLRVPVPIEKVVLNQDDMAEYRYRVIIRRADGTRAEGPWRTDRKTVLRLAAP